MSDAAAWYSTFDDEQRGYIVNRGLDKMDPSGALQATIKAHREAEGKLGIPSDQVLRLPKDPADPAMADVWKRLGAPDTKEGYAFDAVKFKDGSNLDPEDVAFVRDLASDLRLPVGHALKIAERFAARADAVNEADLIARRTAAGAEAALLQQNWGNEDSPQYQRKLFLAQAAREKLGLSKEFFDSIKGQDGYVKAMDEFARIGGMMGEAAFLTSDGGASLRTDAMSRDQALDRKAALMKDHEFGKRWANGGEKEAKELADLDRIITTRPR